MNPFLRYLADKHSAHRQTDTHRHTDRHTPMTTRPCGLRRAGNKDNKLENMKFITFCARTVKQRHYKAYGRKIYIIFE